jgi:hypothetical protein
VIELDDLHVFLIEKSMPIRQILTPFEEGIIEIRSMLTPWLNGQHFRNPEHTAPSLIIQVLVN